MQDSGLRGSVLDAHAIAKTRPALSRQCTVPFIALYMWCLQLSTTCALVYLAAHPFSSLVFELNQPGGPLELSSHTMHTVSVLQVTH